MSCSLTYTAPTSRTAPSPGSGTTQVTHGMASFIEPDLPHDPLAPSGGVDWAVARYRAVRDLEVDPMLEFLI